MKNMNVVENEIGEIIGDKLISDEINCLPIKF